LACASVAIELRGAIERGEQGFVDLPVALDDWAAPPQPAMERLRRLPSVKTNQRESGAHHRLDCA